MIDFSSISRDTPLGRLLRRPLEWLPDGLVVPVLQGELRGAKWSIGSGTHGCWLGSYERSKQQALARHLRSGMVFYDIGANVGFYTLQAARRVGPHGAVHSFEPLPDNLEHLRRHITLNGADNVTVHPLAVADQGGTAKFEVGLSRSVGRLGETGELEVRTVSIDDLVAEGLAPPDIIKMDIEGAEVAALEGARATLEKHRPVLFVATHGVVPHEGTLELLEGLGYRVAPFSGGSPDELEAIATSSP